MKKAPVKKLSAKKPPLKKAAVGKTTRYPANLSIDYPARELNRASTFFRIFLIIPVWILLILLTGSSGKYLPLGGFVVMPTILLILLRRKYPRWWFDWNLAIANLLTRASAYTLLLTDEFPSADEEQNVHLALTYPKADKELNRWLPLVKWFLAIPHYLVLCFLFAAAVIVTVLAWFAILFTGRFPRGLFDFVTGVMRWNFRVSAYAFLLTTDLYPPFTLEA